MANELIFFECRVKKIFTKAIGRQPLRSDLRSLRTTWLVCRKNGRAETLRPDGRAALKRALAVDVTDEDQLLEFANDFGFLGNPKHFDEKLEGETLGMWDAELSRLQRVKKELDLLQAGDEEDIDFYIHQPNRDRSYKFKRESAPELSDRELYLEKKYKKTLPYSHSVLVPIRTQISLPSRKTIRMSEHRERLALRVADAIMNANGSRGLGIFLQPLFEDEKLSSISFVLRPDNFLSFLWLNMAMFVRSKREWDHCAFCGRLYERTSKNKIYCPRPSCNVLATKKRANDVLEALAKGGEPQEVAVKFNTSERQVLTWLKNASSRKLRLLGLDKSNISWRRKSEKRLR